MTDEWVKLPQEDSWEFWAHPSGYKIGVFGIPDVENPWVIYTPDGAVVLMHHGKNFVTREEAQTIALELLAERDLRDATEAAFFCFVKLQPNPEPPESDAPNHVIG